MRKLRYFLWLTLVALSPLSLGCGSSYQSEESARELVAEEDAAEDIEAEVAQEAAEEAGSE